MVLVIEHPPIVFAEQAVPVYFLLELWIGFGPDHFGHCDTETAVIYGIWLWVIIIGFKKI